MNVVRCSNGHFFDASTYLVCPHCGAGVAVVTQQSVQVENKEKKSGFKLFKSWSKTNSETPKEYAPTGAGPVNLNPVNPNAGNTQGKTVGWDVTPENAQVPPVMSSPQPMNPYQTNVQSMNPQPVSMQPMNPQMMNFRPEMAQLHQQSGGTEGLFDNPGADVPGMNHDTYGAFHQGNPPMAHEVREEIKSEPALNQAVNNAPESSLVKEVRQASGNKPGATIGYFNQISDEKSGGGNSAQGKSPRIMDPVTGWIICTKGPHFGESFCIGAGMNSIGRDADNRIVISDDQKISREKHALITYEPKQRNFYIKPGESSGLTYLNGKYIMETKQIFAKDVIEIGDSRFLFVPLCDETFSWEDLIKETTES